ncbi:hypothetical protein [Paracoccus sp. IB05]|uniref:hypothetical protein n=1 Tax=Paracoccus sp. IB05 TaxID=2779367 RepID=UPI001E2DFAA5|nr:hypothetical protein [Paracoccus sp. IB05]
MAFFFSAFDLTCLPLAAMTADQDWRDQAQAAALAWHQENRPAECEIPDTVPASVDDLPTGEDTAAPEALRIGFQDGMPRRDGVRKLLRASDRHHDRAAVPASPCF